MAAFFVNGQRVPRPSPPINAPFRVLTVTTPKDRIAHASEILAEARMRERLADDATWDRLRGLYPPPIMLEGGGM